MEKLSYTPDRTWKNVWTVIRSGKNSNPTLSCKACPNGVKLREKNLRTVIMFLCYTLGFLLPIGLRVFIFPEAWSKTIRLLISIIVLVVSCLPLISIVILISFHFSKWWVPADGHSDQLKTQKTQVTVSCVAGKLRMRRARRG